MKSLILVLTLILFVFVTLGEINKESTNQYNSDSIEISSASSDLIKTFLVFLVVLIVPLLFAVQGYKFLRISRTIEDLPTYKIRSLPMGLVEVKGKILPIDNEVLVSPITKKNCIYYKLEVYTFERHKKGGRSKRTLLLEIKNKPFYIQDETGAVMVDPKKYSHIEAKLVAKYGPLEISLNPYLRQFLSSKIFAFPLYSGNIYVEEYIIEPGDEIYVLGTAMDNPYVKEASSEKRFEDKIITYDKNTKILVISYQDEKRISRKFKIYGIILLLLSLLLISIWLVSIFIFFF